MPNTLAHFGIQGLLTRLAIPTADPKIVFLGCILPDIPWITQRMVLGLIPNLDPYSVRLYVIIQASLFMTLILCGALAVLSKTPAMVFGILAMGSTMHLLLDSLQTKLGNGVHFFAPLSWELLNFELFWPEDLPTLILTGVGAGFFLWSWNQALSRRLNFSISLKTVSLSLALLCIYMTLPVVFWNGPYASDNHYVKTLQVREERAGRPIEFDRTYYEKYQDRDVVHAYGELLHVHGLKLDHAATVSIQGRFLTIDDIEILNMHEHAGWFRDGSSYIGLSLLCVMWIIALYRYARSPKSEK
mgnify:FL=1